MEDIERIIEQLDRVTDDNFFQIEADLFMAFQRIPNEKKPSSVIAFLSVSNWQGASLRSGVWTFYEIADTNDLMITSEYLIQTQQTELADIFAKGIHDYQNPQYADNFDYPHEWMEESVIIDDWIFNNEKQLIEWKRNVLMEIRASIDGIS